MGSYTKVVEIYPKGRYGLLRRGTIIEIHSWTLPNEGEEDYAEELYFYTGKWWWRKSWWCYTSEVIEFSSDRKFLRQVRRDTKGSR
jgi:hypothetical protein